MGKRVGWVDGGAVGWRLARRFWVVLVVVVMDAYCVVVGVLFREIVVARW